ncbi:hypothetical protein ACIPLC_10310 [Kitasatospora sp. NPDC086801]|uniref:hypothetical protein n=1 Tax=Kitasatospora sp. NPDC086801 TaxID=3364066 RepID=UPI0037FC73A6
MTKRRSATRAAISAARQFGGDEAEVGDPGGDLAALGGLPVGRLVLQHGAHQAAVRELDGEGVVGVVDRRDEVAVCGQLLGQRGAVAARAGAAVAEQQQRERAGERGRVGAGGGADGRDGARIQRQALVEHGGDPGRGVGRAGAAGGGAGRVPELHHQFTWAGGGHERVRAGVVDQVQGGGADRAPGGGGG